MTTRTTTRTTTTKTRTDKSRERGVALILVVWTFAALAVLAAEFARAMHDEIVSTRNFKEAAEARYLAVAGVNEAILAMEATRRLGNDDGTDLEEDEEPDPVRSLSRADGRWVKAEFRGHPYEVRVVDESGKLSLNGLSSTQLQFLFVNLGMDDDLASTIADSILDWRDSDDMHQPNGAESDYYEDLPRPYHAKNAAFDSVDELLLVRGVTRDLYYGDGENPGLRELFTVFTKSGSSVNLKTASPAVIQALTGFDRDEVDKLHADRRSARDSGAAMDQIRGALEPSGIAGRNNSGNAPTTVTVEARVFAPGSDAILAHLGAVIGMSSGGDGLKVERWYDSIFDDSDDSTGAPASGDSGEEG